LAWTKDKDQVKIGIDARFLTHPQVGGFKTYSENLIAALTETDHDNEYFLYFDRKPTTRTLIPRQPNVTTRIVPGTLPVLGMVWREQIRLASQVARDQLDLFHAPSLTAPLFLPCPLIVTIHDMIWRFPERFTRHQPWSAQRKLMEWYYRIIPEWAAARATTLLTVSNAAKDSIVEYLKFPAERIAVTYEAASPLYHKVDDPTQFAKVRSKYKLAPNFVLAIGSADPRKNMNTLVQAYGQLPAALREQFPLVIVWTHAFLTAELRELVTRLELSTHIQFLEKVSNEELLLLYNLAGLFVFPSHYEGFGLPPLEAMACGTPVIAADNSSIPEVVGEAAPLFAAEDGVMLASLMRQVLSDPLLRADLAQKGLQRAASFCWRGCAQQTLNAYWQTVQFYRKKRISLAPGKTNLPSVTKIVSSIEK
jgi:glycosyltransferase involved in cell wall biosynthesis